MDSCMTLHGSWDVAADLLFEPSALDMSLGEGIEAFAQEWGGLEFLCGFHAGREAIDGALKLWSKLNRSDVPVGGFKELEIARQLKELLAVLHETGSRKSTPTKDILHQMSSTCKEVLGTESLNNHAYAKVMDNFAVVKYGLEHGRAMSPCNPQGIRFWYTIAGKDAAGLPDDDISEDSWKVGADCQVLESMELELDEDFASSETMSTGSVSSPTACDITGKDWGTPCVVISSHAISSLPTVHSGVCPCPSSLTLADWVKEPEEPGEMEEPEEPEEQEEPESKGRPVPKAPSFRAWRESSKAKRGCGCGLFGAFKRLFNRTKKSKK